MRSTFLSYLKKSYEKRAFQYFSWAIKYFSSVYKIMFHSDHDATVSKAILRAASGRSVMKMTLTLTKINNYYLYHKNSWNLHEIPNFTNT